MGEQQGQEIQKPSKPKNFRPFIFLGLAVVTSYLGFRILSGRNFEGSDDAYVQADLVQLSSEVKGNLVQLLVTDNQPVKKGDLIAEIDPRQYQSDLQQASALLSTAKAAFDSARADYALASKVGSADLAAGHAGELKAAGTLDSALAQRDVLTAQVNGSESNEKVAQLQEGALEHSVKSAELAVTRGQDAVNASIAALNASKSNLKSIQATLDSAKAQADLARKDAERTKVLFNQGAISQQQADTAVARLQSADALVSQYAQSLESAVSVVAQRSAELDSAKAGVSVSRQALAEAQLRKQQGLVQIESARSATVAQRATLHSVSGGVTSAKGSIDQAKAALLQAETLPSRLKQKAAQVEIARAQVNQAEASLQNAKLNLERTKIRASIDGVVSKRYAVAGAFVQPGSPIAVIVPTSDLYVVANFKETQISRMSVGESVEIEVDGIPDGKFKGTIESLSAATGAQFALIPPDNATGNFVKVVQRVPVRIKLEPNTNAAKLAVGMSANVRVKVG